MMSMPGLEINILKQWTTGPPALRIWWSGLKPGGPEIAVIISYIFTWNSLQNAYSEAQVINTHSFGTDCLPSEYWITEDDSVGPGPGCWWWCASTARPALAHGLHIAAVVPKQPRKRALPLSLWLAPIVSRTAFLPAIVSNLFLFPLWQVDAFDKWPHAHTFTITVTDEPEANNMTRKWMTQCGMSAATSSV